MQLYDGFVEGTPSEPGCYTLIYKSSEGVTYIDLIEVILDEVKGLYVHYSLSKVTIPIHYYSCVSYRKEPFDRLVIPNAKLS